MTALNWQVIAQRVATQMGEKRMSSQDLALKAGVDRKTIDRLRAGKPVRNQTLKWIEGALGIALTDEGASADVAPRSLGGYQRQAVEHFVGIYTGFRRSFDRPAQLIASYLEIRWDDSLCALGFTETQRNQASSGKAFEYNFGGHVSIPPNLGVLHLHIRSDDGLVRTATTSMPRDDQGTLLMKGFILTLNEIRDIGYYPVTSPIFFAKQAGGTTPETGVIGEGDERYGWANTILQDIELKFLP
ncbi:MAG: helix-turn-helix transcriptional regulator [Pseudomonadota bacterium]